MEIVTTYFGLWISMSFHDMGLTRTQFAEKLGKHPLTVSKHCRGKANVSLNAILMYAKFFGVDWSTLYDLYMLGEIENGNEFKRKAKEEIIEKLEKQRKNSKSY